LTGGYRAFGGLWQIDREKVSKWLDSIEDDTDLSYIVDCNPREQMNAFVPRPRRSEAAVTGALNLRTATRKIG
jgi:hypothetical protein